MSHSKFCKISKPETLAILCSGIYFDNTSRSSSKANPHKALNKQLKNGRQNESSLTTPNRSIESFWRQCLICHPTCDAISLLELCGEINSFERQVREKYASLEWSSDFCSWPGLQEEENFDCQEPENTPKRLHRQSMRLSITPPPPISLLTESSKLFTLQEVFELAQETSLYSSVSSHLPSEMKDTNLSPFLQRFGLSCLTSLKMRLRLEMF